MWRSPGRGEDHTPETHLIPLILQVPTWTKRKIFIFGDDYSTEDGSCVRDYIHVTDLASAHLLALKYLRNGGESQIINLGNGNGYSVKEVINTCREVTGHQIPEEIHPRRTGDPATLIASSEKAKQILGWRTAKPNLREIVQSAWEWHKSHLMVMKKNQDQLKLNTPGSGG